MAGAGVKPPKPPATPKDKKDDERVPPKGKFCVFHNSTFHDQTECRFILAITEKHRRRKEEREAGEKVSKGGEDEEALLFQEYEDMVAVICGGSSAITSRRQVKMLQHEVCAISAGQLCHAR